MDNVFELYKDKAHEYLNKNRSWYNLSELNETEFNHICRLASSVMMTRDNVIRGGNFVTAIVENDLDEAINRADEIAIQGLKALVAVKRNCFIKQHQL